MALAGPGAARAAAIRRIALRIKYLILFVLLGGIANMKGDQGLIAAALLIGGALLFDRAGLWRLIEGTVDFADAIWRRWQWVKWRWNGGR